MFISVHGIDGTGKTTLTSELVQNFGAIGVDSRTYDELRDVPNCGMSDSRQIKFEGIEHHSLIKKAQQSETILAAMTLGLVVAKDRWLIDVYADGTFRGDYLPSIPRSILMPDVSIVLLCEEEVRQRRIASRGECTPEDLIPNVEGTRARYFQDYLLENISKFACNVLIVDGTNRTTENVAKEICSELL